MLSGPQHWPESIDDAEKDYVFFGGTVNSPWTASFWMEGRGEYAMKRLIGCAYLAYMPELGLDEVIWSLVDAYDFYLRRSAAPDLPALATGHGLADLMPPSEGPGLVIVE